MGKKISDNQDAGYLGEDEFKLWASRMGWYATKLAQDHGLDFVCQLRGERVGPKSSDMPGKVLTVSVRSTDADGDTVTITREDVALLLSTNTPMVFAIVRRGSQEKPGEIAIRFPDEALLREVDSFLKSGAEHHQLRFSDAVQDSNKIRYNTERLFKEAYADMLVRHRAKLVLEGLLSEVQVETIHTEEGVQGIVRSRDFPVPMVLEQRPDVQYALRDIGIAFKALLPSTGTVVGTTSTIQRDVPFSTPVPLCVEGGASSERGHCTESTVRGLPVYIDTIRRDLSLWNYREAAALATRVERELGALVAGNDQLAADLLILLVRVHINSAEAKDRADAEHIQRAAELLARAVSVVTGHTDGELQCAALTASIENLQHGPESAVGLLVGRTDPYSVRTHLAILLNQSKGHEALQLLQSVELHERWCDLAAKTYALNDQEEMARGVVQWAASQSDRIKYAQCLVQFADARMVRTLARHEKGIELLPHIMSPAERVGLGAILELLHPVLLPIYATGKPASGLDMVALQIAWRASYLLQRRETAAGLLHLMVHWTPVPEDVARGVVMGYIEAPTDLPDRLRKEHPADLDVGILAAVIESGSLGRHAEALAHAKELLPLADTEKKKEELYKIFQQVWQNVEGPEESESAQIAESLVTHNPRITATFEAALALRRGDADQAIAILDAQKTEDDPIWLQMRANALLQKGDLATAVDFLLAAAKRTRHAELLHKAGDVAFQAKRYDVAVWCYETLSELQPAAIPIHGNLAHIYTFILHDLEKAAIHFRALHAAEPANLTHTFNLAVCLAQLFRPDESLPLYDDICRQERPPLAAILGRAQLHHSLGRPDIALASLELFREAYRDDPNFLQAYMTAAHAAGKDEAGHDALVALTKLQGQGKVRPEAFRAVAQDEAMSLIKQQMKQAQDRGANLHAEMLRGRMPWVWAEQTARNAVYSGWRTRTQDLSWIGDEPTNRARFCIYSTNSFSARQSERGIRELLPLECPAAGTKVVADISALITLHRLDLLDAALAHFGEVVVPVGYLPTVLEDSRQMVLHQRSRQRTAEQIVKQVSAGRIHVLDEAVEKPTLAPVVDEYADSTDHLYRIRDLLTPISQAGAIADADIARGARVSAKPPAADEQHPSLQPLQEVLIGLNTLEAVANCGLLDVVTAFYRIQITAKDYRELTQRLEAIGYQEETRQWHLDLWTRLRADTRCKFVPHKIPDQLHEKNQDAKDYLPFLGCFVALELKLPLLADDRVCQAFVHNQLLGASGVALGSDALTLALMSTGGLSSDAAAAALLQLMRWRYRFLVATPAILKEYADQYRGNPPGRALRDVAEYVHDCMRDAGLFGGPENTAMRDSIAMRYYLAWVSAIAEFLVLVWADEGFSPESAVRITEWSCRELLPSIPRAVDGRGKVGIGDLTARLFFSHALLKSANNFGEPRMADCMKAMKQGLRLSDDEYKRIVTGFLNDSARTDPNA